MDKKDYNKVNQEEGVPGEKPKHRTRNIIIITIFVIIIICIILIVVFTVGVEEDSSSKSDEIHITIQSSNTKQKWMDIMAENFMNNDSVNTISGSKIIIHLNHTSSPFQADLNPNIWSPAHESYIDNIPAQYVSDAKTLCFPTTNIPVGIAMWRKMAEALGWPSQPISFHDLGELALHQDGWASIDPAFSIWDKFKYGHGHPDVSNSGRLAVVANIFAFSNVSIDNALTLNDVERSLNDPDVIALEQAVYHLGALDTDILNRMLEHGPTYLHAVATYESNVINWNIDFSTELTKWSDDWVFIYLNDGTFWMTNPLCILDESDWTSTQQINASMAFIKYCIEDYNIEQLLKYGIRPPLSSDVDDDITCCDSTILYENGANPTQNVETTPIITYPEDTIMNAILNGWHDIKKTAVFALVIDSSGSMGTIDEDYDNSRLGFAQEALINFINSMDNQDYLLAYSFLDKYDDIGYVKDIKDDLIFWVNGIYPTGQTPLYSTILTAYNDLIQLKENNTINNIYWNYAIVAMTDGKATDEDQYINICNQFANEAQLSTEVCHDTNNDDEFAAYPDIIHFFPIIFGDEAVTETDNLDVIAQISAGKLFESDNEKLHDVYFQISLEL